MLQVARSGAAADVKAVASTIRWDCNLEDLPLEMEIMDTRYVDASYRYNRKVGTVWPTRNVGPLDISVLSSLILKVDECRLPV
jgi:hypothetical protein